MHLGSLSWSQQSPECLKHAAGLKVQHAWPRPHITVGHPGLQRKDSQNCLLPTTSCQNAAEAALKLNIWIEWDSECGLSERCFTKAIRRGPAQHSHAVPSQHQIAMASLCNQQNYVCKSHRLSSYKVLRSSRSASKIPWHSVLHHWNTEGKIFLVYAEMGQSFHREWLLHTN